MNTKFLFEISREMITWEREMWSFVEIQCEGIFIFPLLHRACCRVTQLLHQPLHIYKIYKCTH